MASKKKSPDSAAPGLDARPKQLGGVTGKGFMPGVSGNPSGRAKGDGKMRKLMGETLEMSREQAIEALKRRWSSVKYVQDMAEFYAKLEGELTKDAEGGHGIAVIILNNQGEHPLTPELFRERLEARARQDAAVIEMNGPLPGEGTF